MEKMAILRRVFFLAAISGCITASYATKVECTTKLTPTFCAMLNQANTDWDTFSVSIFFYPPAKDTSAYCRDIDPKQNPSASDSCELSVYDSTYYAKLKSDAQSMFTKHVLWDARHYSVLRLMYPDSGVIGYMGIVANKSTIIAVLEETYVSAIEDWEEHGPAHIMSRAMPRTEKPGSRIRFFLPDGRLIASPRSVTMPYFFK
jgi:hypothetical protein